MSELAGFPMISQLTTITPDGQASTNGEFDCVPASILAGVLYLLGITQLTPEFNPEALKDAAYGKTWENRGTDAANYRGWCAQHGVKLSSVPTASYADAVARAHQFLADQVPVVFTQQDDYAPLAFRTIWTHVCVFYKDAPGELTCMDPFIDGPLTYSDAVWAQRLRSTELWILEKVQATDAPKEDIIPTPITLATPRVSDFFEAAGAMWRCKYAYNPATRKMVVSDKGALVGNAILTYYCSYGGSALCGLTFLGLPITPETSVAQGITAQVFERGIVLYDAAHRVDGPPEAGAVYQLNLCSKLAQSILQHIFGLVDGSALQTQVDTLTKENAGLKDDNQLLTTHISELNAHVNKTGDIQAQLDAAQATLQQIGALLNV